MAFFIISTLYLIHMAFSSTFYHFFFSPVFFTRTRSTCKAITTSFPRHIKCLFIAAPFIPSYQSFFINPQRFLLYRIQELPSLFKFCRASSIICENSTIAIAQTLLFWSSVLRRARTPFRMFLKWFIILANLLKKRVIKLK